MLKNTSGLGCGWESKCLVCGKEFRAYSHNQAVCSQECRFAIYANEGANDDCWNWTGPKVNLGYGTLFIDSNGANGKRKSVQAHRYSYTKHSGKEIPEGLCVMHTCDNPSCVNPSHLKLGTWADNNKDRSDKGRSGSKHYSTEEKVRYSEMTRGSNNPCSKLTEDQAIAIKYNKEMGCMRLSKMYGISSCTVKQIRSGKAWRHI